MTIKHRICDCRQCETSTMEGLDGVITGRKEPKGWCNQCITKSLPLLANVSQLAMEDMDFEDFLKIANNKFISEDIEDFNGFLGTHCPNCEDAMVHGSFFSACRKCSPKYFEPCENCSEQRVSCICNFEGSLI